MSRNYFEYTQSSASKKPEKTHRRPKDDNLVIDPEDDRQANDMNSLMGIV